MISLLMEFLTHINPINFKVFATVLWIIDAVLCTLIVKKVPYTEIDWSTYMQQVSCYERGIRNYSNIEGDTGPVVYPAGHVWFYLVLSHITNSGKNIRFAQYIFELLYLASLLLVFRIYYMSHRLPPFVLIILCCISYRIHSIYLLRLFNDPVAMLFFYLAVNLWISRRFTIGCIFYSLAVSIKMNILLFAPALFFILLLSTGYWNTLKMIILCGMIQIIIALPFILHDPISYLQRSFNLGRIFLYKWTVNWRFLPEETFLDHRFHIILLSAHIFMLFIAGYLWFRRYGGYLRVLTNTNCRTRMLLSNNEILVALFTANLIGISVARSLHYQFYSWYFHTLPYLLFSGLPFKSDWIISGETLKQKPVTWMELTLSILLRCGILTGIELCWNTYPSTVLSSAMLQCLHASILCILIHDYCTGNSGISILCRNGQNNFDLPAVFGSEDVDENAADQSSAFGQTKSQMKFDPLCFKKFLDLACNLSVNSRRRFISKELHWQTDCKRFLSTVAEGTIVFDRNAKRTQRNRAAALRDYNVCQYLKNEIAYRVADKVFDLTKFNDVCIDIGCGGGHIASHLIKENVGIIIQCDMSAGLLQHSSGAADSEVPVLSIVADESMAPFRQQSADLIVSSLSAHWINDLPRWFSRCLSVLRPDCPLIGAMLSIGTLHELRTALQLAEMERLGGVGLHISPFVRADDVGILMSRAGFGMITLDTDELVVGYPDIFALLYDLQSMGESNALRNRAAHLRRDILIAADAIYKSMFARENIPCPASFQIVSFIGWRPGPLMPKPAKRGSQQASFKDIAKIVEGKIPFPGSQKSE